MTKPRDTDVLDMGYNSPKSRTSQVVMFYFWQDAFIRGYGVDIRFPRPVPGAKDPHRYLVKY